MDHDTRRSLTVSVALAAGLVVGATAIARAGGPFTPHGTQPPVDFTISDPSDCAICHEGYDPGRNVEPWNTWAGSMMANAARDPVFWAALDVANHDIPGVGEYCLRCHAPKAWLDGRANAAEGEEDGCTLAGQVDDPLVGLNDFAGISCHYCHRLMINETPPPGEEPFYLENAELWVDDEAGCVNGTDFEPCRRGPYDYPPGTPPHNWAYSPYHTGSALCGACHNVTSPANTLIDEEGNDTGIPYPIERTHREWSQSDFADPGSPAFAECQTCHMPSDPGPDVYACSFLEVDRSGNLPIHQLAGGNAWVPEILRQKYLPLGPDRDAELQATADWARQELQDESATVAITVPGGVAPGGTLQTGVRVTNLTGHKLPTGYTEGRRMWLHVEARDGVGTLLWESGAYDPVTGVLTRDAQVKVYESIRGVWDEQAGACRHTDGQGAEVFHFVLNDCIVLDNRIPPLGFTGGDDPETEPVAYAYPEASPGVLVNWDDTSYAIPVPLDAVTPVTVTATLRYQTSSKEYIDFLRDEAVTHDFPDDCLDRSAASEALLPPVGQRSRGEILHHFWSDPDPALAKSPPVDMVQAAGQVDVTTEIFDDGFESGDTSAWSHTTGG